MFFQLHQVAVAVKTLKPGSSLDEKIAFLSEADMMKRFDHRNIVKLLGVCTRNEPVYMVMEFMLYGDLKTLVYIIYITFDMLLLLKVPLVSPPPCEREEQRRS